MAKMYFNYTKVCYVDKNNILHQKEYTVEPCLTTTPFIRPPRYYDHILSNQT